ncbi:MAG: carbohydrate ABC transporter permease [Gammaproteobacteria bacterium]
MTADRSPANRPEFHAPAGSGLSRRARWSEWVDRHSRQFFIAPAVTVILIFSIFPLIASLVISFTRLRPRAGGYQIRFVGLKNFEKQFTGSEQYHFLGTFGEISVLGWAVMGIAGGAILWWLYRYIRTEFRVIGFVGRLVSASFGFGLVVLFGATLLSGHNFGSLGMTLIYVLVGCTLQFLVGLGLALLCSQPIRGRTFFRVTFFLPLMITPVGIAYQWRMLADMRMGPITPVWQWLGLEEFAWGSDPWSARIMVMIGDAWMWIPFIFVVMLAALESVSRDQVEAGQVDGAGGWLIFRDITWPQIAPVAGTILLIRWIEGFKLVDLPNVMTNGGPGIATETLTLHSWVQWRALDFSGSSAIAYLLLITTVVICVSFYNYVVRRQVKTV